MSEQLDMFATLPLGPRKGEYPMPPNARIERCRSCGAEIVWACTPAKPGQAAGRAIPLSLRSVQTRDGQQWLLSHFSDCEHAKEWSRKK